MYIVLVDSATMLDSPVLNFNGKKKRKKKKKWVGYGKNVTCHFIENRKFNLHLKVCDFNIILARRVVETKYKYWINKYYYGFSH